MPDQFENPKVTKVEDETISDAAANKRIERVAEKAAEKASHTEQNYDQNHEIISNRRASGSSLSGVPTCPCDIPRPRHLRRSSLTVHSHDWKAFQEP